MMVLGKSFDQMLYAVNYERIDVDVSKYEYVLNFQARGSQLDHMS
jgi:hypothetical protein